MMSALTDDNGNQTEWSFDSQNRKIGETKGHVVAPALADRDDADTTEIWVYYGPDGVVSELEKEDGTVVDYTYDKLHRLTQVDVSPITGVLGTTQQKFYYDGLGRVTKTFDNNQSGTGDDVTVKKRYDSLGRTVEETQQIGSTGTWRTVSHDMRSVDVADIVYPSSRQVDYTYWANRALASVKDHGAGSDIADYDYIGGRILKRTMLNGVNLDFENGSATYYDSLGRPTTWKHIKSGSTKVGFDLTYDRAGNPTAISLAHDTAKGSFSSIGYDSANRLLSSTHAGSWSGQPRSEHWTLDGVGNMTYVDGYTTGSRLTTSFNEYYSVAGVTNTQDDNGNLTSDGTLTYKWDGFNRLSEVKNGGSTVADYTYDAEGRRVAKAVSGTTTKYVLDGWREIAEYTNTNAYPDREFVFGSFIDEPLVMDNNDNYDSSATGSGDNRYYYAQNWQYSVAALTNGSGTIVEGYEYEPYGRHRVFYHSGSAVGFTSGDTINDLGTSHYGNPFLYTGRDFDAETGLQYSRGRYYSQAQMRFIGRDPSGVNGGLNLYAFANAKAFESVDVFGLGPVITWIKGSGRPPLDNYFDPDETSVKNPNGTLLYYFDDQRVWMTLSINARNAAKAPIVGEAARALLAYLYGSGNYDFDSATVMREDANARDEIASLIGRGVVWARDNGVCGPFYNIPEGPEMDMADTKSLEGPYVATSEKWHNSLGGFFAGAFGTISQDGSGVIYVELGDRYNFHNSGTTIKHVPIFHNDQPIYENDLVHLEITGLAKPYSRHGGIVMVKIKNIKSFSISDIKSQLQSQ